MPTRFKRFLMAFMMLALPLQAFASVTLQGCNMRAHAEHKLSASMDEAMAGCHERAVDLPSSQPDDHRCSHCSACYLAAAFPLPETLATQATPVPHTHYLHRPEQFSGFIPESPERPPRTHLA